jgi:hypothetical protein
MWLETREEEIKRVREEGRAEGRKQVALNMFSLDYPMDIVMRAVGLSPDEFKAIIKTRSTEVKSRIIVRMIKKGYPLKEISEITELSVRRIKKIAEEHPFIKYLRQIK